MADRYWCKFEGYCPHPNLIRKKPFKIVCKVCHTKIACVHRGNKIDINNCWNEECPHIFWCWTR